MNAQMDERKELMQIGVFKTFGDTIMYLLIKIISSKDSSIGSWALKADLDERGVYCSTATIGRYLKMLDSNGFTVRKSNQGRLLTEKAVTWLANIDQQIARAKLRKETSRAFEVNEYFEFIDLLRARKAIEVEAVRAAVACASSKEIAKLRSSINKHYRYVAENRDPVDPALEFHSIIAEISHNKFIKTMLNILVFEEKQIESAMESLITRERGGIYVLEHDEIARALEDRNEQLAVKLMEKHMEEIISAVEEQIQKNSE